MKCMRLIIYTLKYLFRFMTLLALFTFKVFFYVNKGIFLSSSQEARVFFCHQVKKCRHAAFMKFQHPMYLCLSANERL